MQRGGKHHEGVGPERERERGGVEDSQVNSRQRNTGRTTTKTDRVAALVWWERRTDGGGVRGKKRKRRRIFEITVIKIIMRKALES